MTKIPIMVTVTVIPTTLTITVTTTVALNLFTVSPSGITYVNRIRVSPLIGFTPFRACQLG